MSEYEDTYTGPAVGLTNDEMALELGWAILDYMDKIGMQIIWKRD